MRDCCSPALSLSGYLEVCRFMNVQKKWKFQNVRALKKGPESPFFKTNQVLLC